MLNSLKPLGPWMLLLAMGLGWGLAFSLAKMAILAGGMPFGIAFWQMVVACVMCFVICQIQRKPIPMTREAIANYLLVSVLASSVPSSCLMFAAGRVPAGVVAITIAIVPMLTYALATSMGRESQSPVRLAGLICGIIAILLLVVPSTSLPDRSAVPWILVAAIAPTFHAFNNINLTRPVMAGMHPLHIIFGANLFGAMTVLPLSLASGHMFPLAFPFGVLEWAIFGNAAINILAFICFITTINLAGPVFASQTGYIVTVSGVVWGMVLFGESHSGWVWMSLLVMIIGLSLVSPRNKLKTAP
ncbi:MAG: DMT family transporter [Candidatus Puniceispirillaceae bacterium]